MLFRSAEPLGSLGHDGPLPPLSTERQNVSDYFKEAVAVVTNPAIDRERETEHFSTQVIVGPRPPLAPNELGHQSHVTLDSPLLLDHPNGHPLLPEKEYQELAARSHCLTLGELLEHFPGRQTFRLHLTTLPGETVRQGLERIAAAAVDMVRHGTQLLVLDDSQAFQNDQGWIDPILALGVVDRALRLGFSDPDPASSPTPLSINDAGKINLPLMASRRPVNLRRRVGLVLRSGAIRNLHDLVMSIGLGADAIAPYLLYEAALDDAPRAKPGEGNSLRLANTLKALRSGIEKCTSTMGIHEMRGYGRLFASLGLGSDLAAALGTTNYAGSEQGGLRWPDLDSDMETRAAVMRGEARAQLTRVNHIYPKVWKMAAQLGKGEIGRASCRERV